MLGTSHWAIGNKQMDFFFKAILFNIFQGVGWGFFFRTGQSSLCYPAAIVQPDRRLID